MEDQLFFCIEKQKDGREREREMKKKEKGRDREIKRSRDKRTMGCQTEKWQRAEGLPWF